MLSAKNDIAAEIWCIELWLSFITTIFAKRKGASNHFRVYFTILQKKKKKFLLLKKAAIFFTYFFTI